MSSEAASSWPTGSPAGRIAEFQGLYGTFHVSEILLQKIWLRGEFDRDQARLTSGERVRVVHPGRWNRLGGPDFLGARLVIGDREISGDVEVHFRTEAWRQHGHDRDPGYRNVVLHVVLFPPPQGAAPAMTVDDHAVPTLALMGLLWHDLEEYVLDDAIGALTGRDPASLAEALLAVGAAERAALLLQAARRRWEQKVHFARLRIERAGWDQACHLGALEVLGYAANRTPMLRAGMRHPIETWTADGPTLDMLWAAGGDGWTTRGVRPANHARHRLAQYRSWFETVPDWPSRLRALVLPQVDERELDGLFGAKRVRRVGRYSHLRQSIGRDICGGAVGGDRLDTLVVNLMLPFIEVAKGGGAAFPVWLAWHAGDVPESVRAVWKLVRTGISGESWSNGVAQALLENAISQQAGRLESDGG